MKKIYKILTMFTMVLSTQTMVNATPTVAVNELYTLDSRILSFRTAKTNDGMTYMSWLEYGGIGFDMHLQLYDAHGNKMFGESGMIVDDYPTASWTAAYSLVTDDEGNAYLSWADARHEGENPSGNLQEMYPVIYKINKSGQMLWGHDGAEMGDEYSYPPILYMVNNNLYASLVPQDEWDPIVLVRLNMNDGSFATEPMEIVGPLIGSEGEDFIIVYIGKNGTEAMRYTKDFEKVWKRAAKVSSYIYGGNARFPYDLVSDGKGGVIVSFERAEGMFGHIPVVQYITANGEAAFGDSVDVTTYDTYDHDYCVIGVNTEEEEILATWCMSSGIQAIGAQKLDYFGERLFGDFGLIIQEKNNPSGYGYGAIAIYSLPGDKWLVLFADDLRYASSQIYLECLDNEGNEEWLLPVGEPMSISNPSYYYNNGTLSFYFQGSTYDENDKEIFYLYSFEVSGIETNNPDGPSKVDELQLNNSGVKEYYSIDGYKKAGLSKGINIVKDNDGKFHKVFVK